VRVTLHPVIVFEPDPEAQRSHEAAMNLIADALAEMLIEEARAEVADELGLDEADLNHDRGSVTKAARAELGMLGGAR
jgi:hypothetical protein